MIFGDGVDLLFSLYNNTSRQLLNSVDCTLLFELTSMPISLNGVD